MKATELIKELQNIIDKEQKDFDVTYDDGGYDMDVDVVTLKNGYIRLL